ncbi:MAG: gephyrin-like molybdotransferase Glp, partial [Desulfatiglandales bacterium]
MREFRQVEDSLELLLPEALNKILARSIYAPEDLPHFSRATMDGYAVFARDTFGASSSLPALLEIMGHVEMGKAPQFRLEKGKCASISTGGMLPEGADAVLMLEHTQEIDGGLIEVLRPVAVGENVIGIGEDVKRGELLLEDGRRLSPGDLGLLSALGITRVPVKRGLSVGVISTGDEVVNPEELPPLGKIRDVNSITVSSIVRALGHSPHHLGRARDNFYDLKALVERALNESDIILISGGSSIGTRDLTIQVLRSFEGFRLLCHGIMISPGKPTIMGNIGGKPVIGLPGHVASAFVIMLIIVRPLINYISGMKWEEAVRYFSFPLKSSRNIESQPGREDYVRARLKKGEKGYMIEPIFGKSGLISTIV